MATKKTRKPKAPNRPTLRFTDEELKSLETDMASVGGIPVSLGRYAHHATMQYAKLRKLEGAVRRDALQPDCSKQASPRELLAEAGL